MGKLNERGGAVTSSVFRILTIGLLVVLGVLGYNYWTIVTSHRSTNDKLTKLSLDYEELRSTKIETVKKLEACSEQLKTSGDETKRLKDQLTEKEALVTDVQAQVSQLKDSVAKAIEDKASAEKLIETEKESCRETLQKLVLTAQSDCENRIKSSATDLEAACTQRLRDGQSVRVSPAMPVARIAEIVQEEVRNNEAVVAR